MRGSPWPDGTGRGRHHTGLGVTNLPHSRRTLAPALLRGLDVTGGPSRPPPGRYRWDMDGDRTPGRPCCGWGGGSSPRPGMQRGLGRLSEIDYLDSEAHISRRKRQGEVTKSPRGLKWRTGSSSRRASGGWLRPRSAASSRPGPHPQCTLAASPATARGLVSRLGGRERHHG